MMVSK